MAMRSMLGMALAGLVFALGGCATPASSPESATTAMGGGASPSAPGYVRPVSAANCMKFDAIPPECEYAK